MAFLPMFAMGFLISFNYNVLRTMKDALLVTAEHSGAEVIPFIKLWVMLPAAFATAALYTYLSNYFSREMVFAVITVGFLAFFLLFITVLYPFRELFHPHATADWLGRVLPKGLGGLVAMYRYWTYTLFYVAAEVWGTIMLFTLYWGYANQTTPIEQAKRFFSLFSMGGNAAGIAAGVVSMISIRQAVSLPLFGIAREERWLYVQTGMVLLVGVLMLLLLWVVARQNHEAELFAKKRDEKRAPTSLMEGFRCVFRSPYLFSIMTIVLTYHVVINMVEVMWKHQMREYFATPSDYTYHINLVVVLTGILSTAVSLLVSGNCIRRLGWTFAALVTPCILAVTTLAFYGSYFLQESFDVWVMSYLGVPSVAVVVALGSFQNMMSRTAKYTLYDDTKELAFVPLDPHTKIEGKAAIDGVCSRMGKSIGSLMQQVLLFCCSTITACVPYVFVLILGSLAIWVGAVKSLGGRFAALTSAKRDSIKDVLEGQDDLAAEEGESPFAEQQAV